MPRRKKTVLVIVTPLFVVGAGVILGLGACSESMPDVPPTTPPPTRDVPTMTASAVVDAFLSRPAPGPPGQAGAPTIRSTWVGLGLEHSLEAHYQGNQHWNLIGWLKPVDSLYVEEWDYLDLTYDEETEEWTNANPVGDYWLGRGPPLGQGQLPAPAPDLPHMTRSEVLESLGWITHDIDGDSQWDWGNWGMFQVWEEVCQMVFDAGYEGDGLWEVTLKMMCPPDHPYNPGYHEIPMVFDEMLGLWTGLDRSAELLTVNKWCSLPAPPSRCP